MYLEAYNKAWDAHEAEDEPGQAGRDSVAHRKGWEYMDTEYEKDSETGRWYPEGELPEEEEEEEDKGLVDELKDLV